ncbi:MAG: cellulase family glycosylhydrolase [Solirubrobacteraceae bacterium]
MKPSRAVRRLVHAGVLASVALTACAASAVAAPGAGSVRYSQEGRWITDQAGRVTILHGFNMVNKIQASGYAPNAIGFGADDARFLADNGFDVVRLGIIWTALEPRPGVYDDAYLARIEKTYETLRGHGIAVLLDFHQDQYNERFQGEGAPDWAVLGQAATEDPSPQLGFPFNYVLQDAVNHAYDAFWANAVVPGTGRGVQNLYADAWAHVARRFAGRPGIVGYNLFNEPWPGTSLQKPLAQGCATGTTSCGIQQFEATTLTAFHRRVVAAIRRVDQRSMVWAAPTLAADFGATSGVGKLDGPAGFAFNAYCGQAEPGIDAVIPYAKGKPCSFTARLSFTNAEAVSRRTGQALLMTEFGATDTIKDFRDYVDGADKALISWTSWSYWNTDVAGPRPAEGIIKDISKAPTGANVKTAKLKFLARPYAASTSGTPRTSTWTASSRTFRLSYTPRRAGGGKAFGAGSVTEVRVPKVQYPTGYGARVTGARVTSKVDAPVLRLALCPGASRVTVRLKPGHTAAKARRCS